jgi:NADPH-dependent ferric siderophore reductase
MEEARIRREPPRFRAVSVGRVEPITPRLSRVVLTGPELEGLVVDQPAASIRLLLPDAGSDVVPSMKWNGNEFLLADGGRPTIRTLTPRRFDATACELDVEIVLHGPGRASTWAATARAGDPAAVSGTGRGYAVDPEARRYVVLGDETAIPAIGQVLDALPAAASVDVHGEVAQPEARMVLGGHASTVVTWHQLPSGEAPGATLSAAIRAAELRPETKVWAAGEAAAMQRIRRHLFDERGMGRVGTWIRGYWKHGRSGDAAGDDD